MQVRIDATNSKLQSVDASLRVERVSRYIRRGKVIRFGIRCAKAEYWRGCLATIKSWEDIARRVAAILLLHIRQCGPVVEESSATLYQPFAVASYIPCDASAWAEDVRDRPVERMIMAN